MTFWKWMEEVANTSPLFLCFNNIPKLYDYWLNNRTVEEANNYLFKMDPNNCNCGMIRNGRADPNLVTICPYHGG